MRVGLLAGVAYFVRCGGLLLVDCGLFQVVGLLLGLDLVFGDLLFGVLGILVVRDIVYGDRVDTLPRRPLA